MPKKREWGLKKLGVKPWIAHELAHIKGYMKAVRLPQIKKAISKEKLTKRGLVSQTVEKPEIQANWISGFSM